MKQLNLKDVTQYVEENISTFHTKRIESLNDLKLTDVLKRKNPYLFKAKHVITAQDIVKGIADAHISSNEETLFGEWLEGLAIFINSSVFGGWKSGIPGIDLEFDFNKIRYIVNIKSGPNWGNSRQIKEMRAAFKSAKIALRTSNSGINTIAINGCCYGRDNKSDKGDYYKFCGQKFWEFISGESSLYTEIIEPLGHNAFERNQEFSISYSNLLNKFTSDFLEEFCFPQDKSIDWQKIIQFNSSIDRPKRTKKKI